MKITNQQKVVIALCTGMIIVLSATTIVNRPDLTVKGNTPDRTLALQEQRDRQEYEQYLASLETDPEASKQLLQDLVSESDVRQEVVNLLAANRPLVVPKPEDTLFTVSNRNSKDTVARYFEQIGQTDQQIVAENSAVANGYFSTATDRHTLIRSRTSIAAAQSSMQRMTVPQEALLYHKARWNVLNESARAIDESISYAESETANWPEVYDSYRIVGDQFAVMDQQQKNLTTKYGLDLPSARLSETFAAVFLVKKAEAQLFGLDGILGSIFKSAFSAISKALIETFLNKIDNSFRISNFLYYTDALVQGQYADDYLAKYITSSDQQKLLKQLIPEFSCGFNNPAALKNAYKQKALEYIGFDLDSVKPSDPDFYEKMLRLGDFFASPQGWELYLEDVASQVRYEAKNAAVLELVSPGVKVSRSQTSKEIEVYLEKIRSSVEANIAGAFNFDASKSNSGSFLGQIIDTVTQSITDALLHKFIFKGATFKEQKVCVQPTGGNPLVPIETITAAGR
jgi:hypothetical protein